ncbi:MAG: nuclear transport factor 2 family protein [Chlorobiaceae bacterium]|nr:nuclear transport factor 2 family protein [Chlorobiaceae bacterium]
MDTRQLIEAYHKAWTIGTMDEARSYLADNLDFQGSINTFTTADNFMKALADFRNILRGVTRLKTFCDGNEGVLLYDCDTESPAGVVRTAEFLTVTEGKISAIRLVFDATALRPLNRQ